MRQCLGIHHLAAEVEISQSRELCEVHQSLGSHASVPERERGQCGQWGEVMIEFVEQAGGDPSAFHDLYPAGSGRFGAQNGDGRNADFVLPAGLAVGPDGTIYVADAGNSLLRAVTP